MFRDGGWHRPRTIILTIVLSLLLAALVAWLFPAAVGAQAHPTVTAVWVAPNTAEVSWSAPGNLYRIDGTIITWIDLYDAPGTITLQRGCDQRYAPKAGDIYLLREVWTTQTLATALLGPQPLWFSAWLPSIANDNPPMAVLNCS